MRRHLGNGLQSTSSNDLMCLAGADILCRQGQQRLKLEFVVNFRVPVTDFRGPPAYPHLYPGERPPGDFVISYCDGVPTVFSVSGSVANLDEATVNDGLGTPLGRFLNSRGRASAANRIPTLAYGSNVCPMQLVHRKFGVLAGGSGLPNIEVVVLRGATSGYAVAYLPAIAMYGSVPGTLVPSAGSVETYCLLVDQVQLLRLHETEELESGLYRCAELPFVQDELRLKSCYGYIGGDGGDVLLENGQPVIFAGPEFNTPDEFVPIASQNSPFPQRTQLQMMKYCAGLVHSEFGEPLYKPSGTPGQLSAWAEANRAQINQFLRTRHGRRFSTAGLPVVEQPWDLTRFRTLAEVR